MIGGIKTEESIINELRDSEQFERWINSGSNFGLIIPGQSRTFQYEDFRGDTVYVNEVSSKYRDGVNNIAVFNNITKPKTGKHYGISKAVIHRFKKPCDLVDKLSKISISGSKKPYS